MAVKVVSAERWDELKRRAASHHIPVRIQVAAPPPVEPDADDGPALTYLRAYNTR